jgi:hypothetical protein
MQQLDVGLYLTNQPWMLGIWYRGLPVISNTYTKDAITLLGGINIGAFSVSYSYDLTMSKLVNTTGGSHELAVIYKFANPTGRNKRIRAVPCPHF